MSPRQTPIRCVIIDDEPLARKGLREYIADIDFLELVAEFDHPLQAMDRLNSGEVDLLFLDIQMPRMSGLELLRAFKHPPLTILTTAYSEYALEGYELEVVDYLVKPIGADRFLKAVLKAREILEWKSQPVGNDEKQTPYFFIKADNRLVRISFDELQWVEALQNYVTLHTVDRKYITYLTFKAVEEYLPGDRFIKVHKSYIVSAAHIDSIEGNDIWIGKHQIPISRGLKDEVYERLLKGKYWKRKE